MIIVDASIWIDHIRAPDDRLKSLLGEQRVLVHPFVIGEIALGRIASRERVLAGLNLLPRPDLAMDFEVLHLIEEGPLFGRGLGYVDVHLLASTRLTAGAKIWTRDRRLLAVAIEMGVDHQP